jgi:leucyl-tRNA synthetase
MGKRFPEYVVDPNVIVNKYGADTMRLYEMFMGPLEASKPWSDQGVDGSRKWLERVWRLVMETTHKFSEEATPALDYVYNFTVKKVSEDYESLNFNTAISQMMIFVNAVYKEGKCPKAYAEGLIKMLSCICPHIGEELWSLLGHTDTIAYESWPTYDEAKTADDSVEIALQVNGKLRGTIMLPMNCSKDDAIAAAKADERIAAAIEGKTIVKEIAVPNKIVNIVVK